MRGGDSVITWQCSGVRPTGCWCMRHNLITMMLDEGMGVSEVKRAMAKGGVRADAVICFHANRGRSGIPESGTIDN